MNYHVRHVTEVRYDGVVNLARFNLRLKPAEWPGQTLTDYRLTVSPEPKTIVHVAGPFVVNVTRLTLDRPTASLTVTSEFTVTVDHAGPRPGQQAPSLPELEDPGARGSRPERSGSG